MLVPLGLTVTFVSLLSSVNAQAGQTCNAAQLCTSAAAPCCSEFGYCGTGTFCLGGCNPLASLSLTSCKPEAICKNATYAFKDNSRILTNATYYDGNTTTADWVVDKGTVFNTNANGGELAMVLTENNGGTRLSSTRYVHYGKITANLKTGRWGGVVTAFITMSDVKDEIDWEFPGANTTSGQTNFFWQGYIPTVGTNGGSTAGLSDTYSNYHDYTIDWTPDTLTFLVDEKVVRTVNKADHVDANGVSTYPSTPSRIQLSIWPAGISSSPPGTVAWAGGMIDWTSADYKSAGQYYALVKSVSVECADPTKAGPNITSYIYGANITTNTPSIAMSNHSTTLNAARPSNADPINIIFAFLSATVLMLGAATL